MLEHGGHLLDAAIKYNIPKAQWIDLSTGINPSGWVVPEIPAECWQRLPETSDGLSKAAEHYYQCDTILPVAGSQAAIQTLPLLRAKSTVGVLSPAYAEHAYSWKKAGHHIISLKAGMIDSELERLDVLILINPNNPTGQRFSKEQLLTWHEKLNYHNGWLIIDEAFIDTTPEHSLSSYPVRKGLIILRSIGKFFGLAGIRCGFVIAINELLKSFEEKLGPWPISHPSRYIATLALTDFSWQKHSCNVLKKQSVRLHQILTENNLEPEGGTELFQWVKNQHALKTYESLAQYGILTRFFKQPESLRFGLPRTEPHWEYLEKSLKSLPLKLEK